jgi:uncharacterized protein YndB with AHSA1/START domain
MNDYGQLIAADTLRLERVLPGPIERVWEYLVDDEKRARWLAGGTLDARDGGAVALEFRNSKLSANDDRAPDKYARFEHEAKLSGEVLECDPPRVLAFTWGGDSSVRFELHAQGDDVRLVLTHSRLADREDKLAVASGWHTHLGILDDVLHARAARPFWRTLTKIDAEYERRLPA